MQAKTTSPVQSLFERACAFDTQGKLEEARAAYREVLAQDYAHSLSWINLGSVLRRMSRFDAAIACSQRAIELEPHNPYYLMNYGNCLLDVSRLDESLAAHAKAARLKPDDLYIRKNYARSLAEAGRLEESQAQFAAALALKPGDPELRWSGAENLLRMGRFDEGWREYEARLGLAGVAKSYSFPHWRGEDLRGKSILIGEEQGFGDSILCTRYLPLLKAQGAKVFLKCRKDLQRLFEGLACVDGLLTSGQPLAGTFDYHASLLSLPGIFGTNLSSIPAPLSLHVPPLSPQAKELLARAGGRMKVGIVWAGSPSFILNHRRAVEAKRFLPLAEIPGVQLFSLQKGPFEGQLKECGGDAIIIDLAPHLRDFGDTAAVLQHLDLVVMTDSAVAHLAGALNRPVWNLLPFRPYWLYMDKRSDSPWYPSMTLFRQKHHGDWQGVFNEVQERLSQRVRQDNAE